MVHTQEDSFVAAVWALLLCLLDCVTNPFFMMSSAVELFSRARAAAFGDKLAELERSGELKSVVAWWRPISSAVAASVPLPGGSGFGRNDGEGKQIVNDGGSGELIGSRKTSFEIQGSSFILSKTS